MNSIRVATIAIAICLACTLVVAQPPPAPKTRPGLCISTSGELVGNPPALSCDVMANGVLQGRWGDFNDPHYYPVMTPWYGQPTFYFAIDPTVQGASTQAIELDYTHSYGVMFAQWSFTSTGVHGPELKEYGTVYNNNWNTLIQSNGSLICQDQGIQTYLVSVIFPNSDYSVQTIYFLGGCARPVMSVGTYGGVHRLPPYDADVLSKNVVVSSFMNYVITNTHPTFSFYTFLDGTQPPGLELQPYDLVVQSLRPEVVTVQADDPNGWAGFAFNDTDPGQKVKFICQGQGGAQLESSITASLTYGWLGPSPVWSFLYRCGTLGPVPGLMVSNYSLGWADVVSNGITQFPWNITFDFTPDRQYDIVFYLTSPTITNLQYTTTFTMENTAIFSLVPSSAGTMNGTIVPTYGATMAYSIVCNDQGTAHALVKIEYPQSDLGAASYDPTQMLFRYTCIYPFFDMGTADNGIGNLIFRSVGAPGITNMHYGANQDIAQMYLWLDPQADTIVHHNSYQLYATQTVATGPLANVLVVDGNAGNATLGITSPVTIVFNCDPCATSYNNVITVTLVFGWSTPAQFQITKDCVAKDASVCNNGSGGGGGWSPAGIFFFVLFLVITFACIGGCIYNRFKLRASGLAIIPGAVTVESWFDRCRTNNRSARWSPQDNEQGGSSYSNYQGSTNYSSNL